MTPKHALLVAFLFLFGYWFLSPNVFNYFIGVEIPFLGQFGVLPFAFLNEYSVLVGGGFTVLIYYLMTRKGGKES